MPGIPCAGPCTPENAALADICLDDISTLQTYLNEPAGQRLSGCGLVTSVVIPLSSGARHVEEFIASVLQQTHKPDEIIVIDDGSADESAEIVRSLAERHPIALLTLANGSVSSARNLGIRHARGHLIAFLDQDAVWYPTHLAELIKPFRETGGPTLGWSYGNVDRIDLNGKLIASSVLNASSPGTTVLECLARDVPARPSVALISRAALDAVGGFDTACEDDDLFRRLAEAGYSNVFVDLPLSCWRVCEDKAGWSSDVGSGRMTYGRRSADLYPDDEDAGDPDLTAVLPRLVQTVTETQPRASRNNEFALLQNMAGEPAGRSLARAGLLITVVIPLHREARHLAEALHSIADQTLPPDEVIVVHDGSNPAAAQTAARLQSRLPITLLTAEAAGASPARNHGVRHAHGDLIALLDPDDFWYPSHLAELVEPFKQARSRPLGWVYGNADEIDSGGELITRSCLTTPGVPHPKIDIADCLRNDMLVPASASLISRQAFAAIGGFDAELSGYADDDLFIRLLEAGYDNVFVDLPLSRWRQDPEASHSSIDMAAGRVKYARKLIAAYPADDARGITYARDLIIPRFLDIITETMRRALRAGNVRLADAGKQDIESLSQLAGETALSPPARTNLVTTVIIPLFNGARTIEEALRSVLEQTLPPDEIIVVDDGSADNGPEIVARMASQYPIILLRKPNGGQSSARNVGVRHAHGDLIALLDQDDTWYPLHLAELTKPFREPRSRPLGWTYSNLDEIDRGGNLVSQGVLRRTGGSTRRPTSSTACGRTCSCCPRPQ